MKVPTTYFLNATEKKKKKRKRKKKKKKKKIETEMKILAGKPTLRAFLLNLFIIENCLSLDLTTSPRGTFGAFLAFWSHGCSVKGEEQMVKHSRLSCKF